MWMNRLVVGGSLTLFAVGLLSGCGTNLSRGSKAPLNSSPNSQTTRDVSINSNATGGSGASDGSTTPQSNSSGAGTSGPSTGQHSEPAYPSFGIGTSGGAVLALNERLAELGFLPVQVSGQAPAISADNLRHPAQVSFEWKYSNTPQELRSQWSPNAYTEITRGAVIALEHQYGLATDGVVGPRVWQAILSSNAKPSANPYTYVLVTKSPAPEKLRVWQNGQYVYSSLCNTGVSEAPTPNGTYAVYLRFLSQTMKGTNPDGTKYSDPGVPYINYFNGSDAIHGFPRASYGSPQSVGCVELPISAAKTVWSFVDYGTLVTIEGDYTPPVVPIGDSSSKSSGSAGRSGAAGGSGSGHRTSTGGSASKPAGGSSSNSTGGGTGTSDKSTGTSGNTKDSGGSTSGMNNTTSSSGGTGTNNTAGSGGNAAGLGSSGGSAASTGNTTNPDNTTDPANNAAGTSGNTAGSGNGTTGSGGTSGLANNTTTSGSGSNG